MYATGRLVLACFLFCVLRARWCVAGNRPLNKSRSLRVGAVTRVNIFYGVGESLPTWLVCGLPVCLSRDLPAVSRVVLRSYCTECARYVVTVLRHTPIIPYAIVHFMTKEHHKFCRRSTNWHGNQKSMARFGEARVYYFDRTHST